MWLCHTCGREHDEPPLCYGAEAPWRALVDEPDFESRVELSGDQCIIDDSIFFLRGHIEIPVLTLEECFSWSVWCSLSRESFEHVARRWDDPNRVGDSYYGWLSTSLPLYPETLHLKTNVVSRAVGQVPLVQLEPSQHPLALEQQNGITIHRVFEIAHLLLHAR
jgi:hypothetical protein